MKTHMETLAELDETRKASAETAEAFESFKKKTAADLESLQQEKAKLSKELTAALTEARDKARDLETKLAAEQVKVATLREEKQKLMSGTTTSKEEIARIQKRVGELETAAGRVGDLEKRLQERDQEIGKLRQAAADRELFASKVAALMQEREQLTAELAKQKEARSGEQARSAQGLAAKEAVNQRLTKIRTDLAKSVQAEIAKGDIRIQQVPDRVTITIMDRLLFKSGESQVKQTGLNILKRMGDVLKNVPGQQIQIEAHTDNVQGGAKLTEQFPANWKLCTARATNVVRSLVERGGLDRATLSAVGCVDSRPSARNETEGRSTNRRIEIVLFLKDLPESASRTTP